jgi:uncharacterized protein (TIGR02421 family)
MVQEKVRKIDVISDRFIEEVCHRLSENKRVRRTLPLDGRLHIDRTLPFLCVYRRPLKRPDQGTGLLVKGEAAYLVTSASPKLKPGLSALVRGIVKTLSSECKAFLILELWTGLENRGDNDNQILKLKPAFRIIMPKEQFPTKTIESLEKALKHIKIHKQKAVVELVFEKKQWPTHLTPFFSSAEANLLNCFMIGLEVEPVFRNPETGEVYPLVLRKLHQGLARAIKQGVFEFSHHQTTHRPVNYQALGRRALVKAVWHIDRHLAEIGNAFDFLLQVTPVNIDQAWYKFKRNQFERAPVFHYRPLPVDPALLKQQLYGAPIEDIEDPTLASLFREKQVELERELSMLRDRGTRNFLYGSLQLFGNVNEELAALASEILRKIPPHSREISGGTSLDAGSFAARAREEVQYYREKYPGMSCKVQIRDDTTGLMVSRGNLFIGKQLRVHRSRVEALLQHEVGTHALTYFNGSVQPFRQLYTGLPGYDELQEGLAVLAEYLVGGLSLPRLRLLAGRVLATRDMISGASFVDTFRQLNRKFGFERRTSYTITARIYRSGGLSKDAVYLRGLVRVLKYFGDGGELEPLLVGKIAANHISVIRELQSRQVLKPIPLKPRYLDNPQARERLKALEKGVSVLDLIKWRIK